MRRFTDLEGFGLTFIRHGPWSGGERRCAATGHRSWSRGRRRPGKRVEPVPDSDFRKVRMRSLSAWLGENGAGHFVKTIHTGMRICRTCKMIGRGFMVSMR